MEECMANGTAQEQEMIIVFMVGGGEELVEFPGLDLYWEATGVCQDLGNCDVIELWGDITTHTEQKTSWSLSLGGD